MKGDMVGHVWRAKRGQNVPTLIVARRNPSTQSVLTTAADDTQRTLRLSELKAQWVPVGSVESWPTGTPASQLIERVLLEHAAKQSLKRGQA